MNSDTKKQKYFLFLGKKLSIISSNNNNNNNGYYIDNSNNDNDLYMPWCDILFEDYIKDKKEYEYTLGRYNCGIWETYLSFTSKDKLIIEEVVYD